jgi:hypothetical protein
MKFGFVFFLFSYLQKLTFTKQLYFDHSASKNSICGRPARAGFLSSDKRHRGKRRSFFI